MTATITERPLGQLSVGDQVEAMAGGQWRLATVTDAPCGCHVDVRFDDDGRAARYNITEPVMWVRWPQSEAGHVPIWEEHVSLSLSERLAEFDRSGLVTGDRVMVTMLASPQSNSALQRADYDRADEWVLDAVDRSDRNRTFAVARVVPGEGRISRWVANIGQWTEPLSHGETGVDPEWPREGEHVQFEHAGTTVYGVVDDVPVDRTARFCVRTVNHGRLYPRLADMSQPDPLEWAQALRADDPEAQRLITAITEAQASVDATAEARQEFLDTVQEVASRVANDEEWCEVADAGLRKLGLARLRDEPATQDVGWSVDVTVSVERTLDYDEVETMLADHFNLDDEGEVDAESVTLTGTVGITASGTLHEMPEGECICENIDRHAIRDALPNWARGLSFDHDEVTCDNDN